MSETHDGRVLERVPLDRITPGPNVRTEFGDLEGLAASIREHGVLTPLLLRRLNGDDSYELVAGERRYRAAVLAGVADVPAQVETPEALDTVAEVRRVAEQLAENGHRLDLTPAEEMHGVQQLLGLGLTDEDVATQTGNEPAQVAAMRRVLALPEAARTLIDEGALSLTAAAELAATEDEEIVARALTLIDEGYSPDSAARHAQAEITRRRVLEDAHARLAKAGVPEIDPPTYGYSFGAKSKKRVLGKGYECLHVPLKQHRRMACHAAYINRYAQSSKNVERAFRTLKSVDLQIRPLYHWSEDRVRAHVLLCMLAYYVQWHMERAWAPLLFRDEQPLPAENPVAPARRSAAALRKVQTQRLEDGGTVHSFGTLLSELATLTRNRMRLSSGDAAFDALASPTPLQRRALELLQVSPGAL